MNDAYRFGSLLWEVVTRRDPTRELIDIKAIEEHSLMAKITTVQLNELKQIVELCWDPDISNRPSMESITFVLSVLLRRHSAENLEWKQLELIKPVI